MNPKRENKIVGSFSCVKSKRMMLAFHSLFSNTFYILFLFLLAFIFSHASTFELQNFIQLPNHYNFNYGKITLLYLSNIFLAILYFMNRSKNIYLVDFSCYKPPATQMCNREQFMTLCVLNENYTKESVAFKMKIVDRSGLGPKTYAPKALLQIPINQCLAEARNETETMIFEAIDELFKKTKLNPKDLGIVIVNSSLFNPVPSLSATIVNRYKLRENILSYNLGGMGCSAGLISIDLVKDLLQVCDYYLYNR